MYGDRDADRDAHVTDAEHVRERNPVRHGEDVAEEEQTRVRHHGRVQEIGRAREPSGGTQGTSRRGHDTVVRKDRNQVQRAAEGEHSHSGKAPVRDHEDPRQGVRPDVEDPMEPWAPARDHGDDRDLDGEGAEDRRDVPQMHPAQGREAPARGSDRDHAENDDGEQEHALLSTRRASPFWDKSGSNLQVWAPKCRSPCLISRTPRPGKGPSAMKSRLVRIATALAGLAALAVVIGAPGKFH